MIAIQSNPVESNDTIKCLHAQQKVCTRIVRQSEALGGNWKTGQGVGKVTWALSVEEQGKDSDPEPPLAQSP